MFSCSPAYQRVWLDQSSRTHSDAERFSPPGETQPNYINRPHPIPCVSAADSAAFISEHMSPYHLVPSSICTRQVSTLVLVLSFLVLMCAAADRLVKDLWLEKKHVNIWRLIDCQLHLNLTSQTCSLQYRLIVILTRSSNRRHTNNTSGYYDLIALAHTANTSHNNLYLHVISHCMSFLCWENSTPKAHMKQLSVSFYFLINTPSTAETSLPVSSLFMSGIVI